MKKILTMALSVMVFTGAMAQQKAKEVSLKAKSNEEVKLNKKSVEGSQSANTDIILNTQDLKSKAKEQKNVAKEKVKAGKEAIDKKAANAEPSVNGEVGIGGTLNGNTHGVEVSNAAQSDVTTGTKGTVVSNIASVKSHGNTAVKTTGNLGNHLNSSIKSATANVKTDVKVKTDVQVKPKGINAKVKTVTGIKL